MHTESFGKYGKAESVKLSGSFSCPNITAQALLTDEIATNDNKVATVFKKYCLNFSMSNVSAK